MHSTLPSSLARFRQPSRATSKNGLFIALGTTANLYFCWANAGLAMITTATVARISFFISLLHAFMPILRDRLAREADRPCRCWHRPGQYSQILLELIL